METKTSNELKNAFVEGKIQLTHLRRSPTTESCSKIKQVSQRIDHIRKELAKRMLTQRNATQMSERLLIESFTQKERNIRDDTTVSLSGKSHIIDTINKIKKLDWAHQKHIQGKLSALQDRFSSIKNQATVDSSANKSRRTENFENLGEATQRVVEVEGELRAMRERASAHLTELNEWRNRAMHISDGLLVTAETHQQALQDLKGEYRRKVGELNDEITALRLHSQMVAEELHEHANESASLRQRVQTILANTGGLVFPRNFLDPLTQATITDPAVCDKDGFCFGRSSLENLFAQNSREDGTVAHPMTRESMKRDQFVDAPNLMDAIRTAIPEATPGNAICPITGRVLTDPLCTLDGECFEKEAVDDLFRRADATGVPAVHPTTREALKRDDFLSNPNWKSVLSEFKVHISELEHAHNDTRESLQTMRNEHDEMMRIGNQQLQELRTSNDATTADCERIRAEFRVRMDERETDVRRLAQELAECKKIDFELKATTERCGDYSTRLERQTEQIATLTRLVEELTDAGTNKQPTKPPVPRRSYRKKKRSNDDDAYKD